MSRGRRLTAVLAAVLAAALLATPAHATTLPTGFDEPKLVSGLSRPSAVAWAPDGRMFIVTKDGLVQVASDSGSGSLTPATTWLDLRSRVSNDGDRGLLGVAVDSDYANNRYVYLLYTNESNPLNPTGPQVSQLMRVTVNADGTAGTQTVILGTYLTTPATPACPQPSNTTDCIASDSQSHSIGTVRSDPADGTLWISSGDGAGFNAADPVALRTYDENSLNGKILHVDRNGQGVAGHPFCTSDNVLSHNCTKLYAKGFRNPFRFTLRPNGAGPAVGDVGWSSWEEFDLVQAGGDYGWPCYEAQSQTPGYKDMAGCSGPGGEYTKPTKSPAYWYAHDDPSNAIVAGPTYTGTEYPAGYRDTIFVGDYGSGYIRRWDPASQPGQVAIPFTPDTSAFSWVDLEAAPAGLSYANAGDLIYVSLADFNDAQGWVGRIHYTSGNHFPVARASGFPTTGSLPLTVNFTGDQSTDQDGDNLSYDWNFGDGTSSTVENPSHQYATAGQYTARLTVNDGRGLSDSKTVTINAGGPAVTINAPANNSTYRDGASVPLQASATDAGGQPITNATYSWHVIIHHSTHLHDLGFFSGPTTSFTARTDHDADSHYEVTVKVTDANDLTDTRTVSIFPQTVAFTLNSSPAGATMTYGGIDGTAPFNRTSAIGYVTSISAAASFASGGTTYVFQSWSDGGARLHNVTIPATAQTLTASYVPAGPAPSSGGSVGGSGAPGSAPADRRGPTLRFGATAAGLRRGRLVGTVDDPAGIRAIEVAVRARHRGGTPCRWWSWRRRALGKPRTCSPPVWIRAWVTGKAWTAWLGGPLPRGNYVVLVRAVDRRGNATTHFSAVRRS